MQALVRAQARVRARQVRVSLENQVARKKVPEQDDHENHVREIEVGHKSYKSHYDKILRPICLDVFSSPDSTYLDT